MFQVERERSVAIHPHEPAPTTFGGASSVVADNLDDLLGEQLLPLRARNGDEDEPHLLAVDAAGQPVVVEIVGRLDRTAIVRALTYAGRAARMSTTDLAAAYRGGPERFAAHLQAFRETVPATALLSTSVRAGSRLLIVCAEIAEDAVDGLEFLLQPGWQVQLLQVGVVRSPDGQRIVDVAPLTRREPARRAMEPTPLRLVRPSTPPSGTSLRATGSGGAEHGQHGQYGSFHGAPAVDERAAMRAEMPERPSPVVVAPSFARPMSLAPDAGAESLVDALPRWAREPEPAPEPAYEPPAAPHVMAVPEPDPSLAGAASEMGEPTLLLWPRPHRGLVHTATLRTDGLIELADGSLYADPDEAAVVASDSTEWVDGWRSWRFATPDGPTLAEAFGF